MTVPVSEADGAWGVTIITVTNRPDFIRNIFANYKRQKWAPKQLIIVLNSKKMKQKTYRNYDQALPGVSVYQTPASWPLGRCLNYGVSKAKHAYIAKFDDDDYYSPYYVQEAMREFEHSDADVVGKRQFYLYFLANQALVKGKMASSRQVAGATLMFQKRVFAKVKFSRVPRGSDMRFLRDCARSGYRIASTSMHNFTALRRADQRTHTWKVTKRTFRWLQAKTVARTRNYRKLVTRKIN